MGKSPNTSRDDGLPNRTRAHRGGGLSPRIGPPGRETGVAESTHRRGWAGFGGRGSTEKNVVGRLVTDFTRVATETLVLTIPTLLALPPVQGLAPYDVFNTWILAWIATLLVGTLVRGGWIDPPLTDAPGWGRLLATLLLFRLLYFNGTVLVAVGGGLVVATLAGAGSVAWPFALAVGALSALLFPAAVDGWMARVGRL